MIKTEKSIFPNYYSNNAKKLQVPIKILRLIYKWGANSIGRGELVWLLSKGRVPDLSFPKMFPLPEHRRYRGGAAKYCSD